MESSKISATEKVFIAQQYCLPLRHMDKKTAMEVAK